MLEKIIFELEEKTRNSIEDSDLKKIFYHLEKINTPTLLCGVGGSHVVSIFLEKVLREKNHIIVKNIDVEEYFLGNFNQYDNLIAVSYSGKNHGIKSLMKSPKQKYLLTSRKSKIKDEVLLNYSISNRSKSFISLEDTFIPIHILTSYYLNSYSIYPKFHKIDFTYFLLTRLSRVNTS